jgi:DNA (cytosine-5)-methyltransferase 1
MKQLIVDNFAGGGGASTGIALALGREPDIAINHDRLALAMHEANHPLTHHMREDVWNVDPEEATGGHAVGLGWFSPDCRHHSKAKGGKPVDNKIRGLAWVAVKWAKQLPRARRPRVIILENVEEFRDWGPIDPSTNMPLKDKLGLTYRRFKRALEKEGYVVDDRELRACDYGAPTSRKRLFLVARCDGRPIVWPTPTHGPGRSKPHHTAAECIDFSIPCRSIFGRDRPLAFNTLRRIARGVQKFVIDSPSPYFVQQGNGGIAPYLVPRYGERPGQAPRTITIEGPMPTIVPTQNGAHLVAAFLAKHNGGNEATGQVLDLPVGTITATDTKALVTSHLMKLKGTCKHGQQLTLPFPTVQAGGNHLAEVRAFLIKFYSQGGQWGKIDDPMPTIPTVDRIGLVVVRGELYRIVDIGMRMLTPRELAIAQGFPSIKMGDDHDYILDPIVDSKRLAARHQVRMIGNSVCPQVAAALVNANCADLALAEAAA